MSQHATLPKYVENEEKVELSFACRDLRKLDSFSNTDSRVFIYQIVNHTSGNKKLLGKTEIIWNDSNPIFRKKIEIELIFEKRQLLVIEVRDIDKRDPGRSDLLGEVRLELGKLLSSKKNLLVLSLLERGRVNGRLIVSSKPAERADNFDLDIQLSGKDLTNFGWIFNSIKPVLRIYRANLSVHQSKMLRIKNFKAEDLEDKFWDLVFDSGKVKADEGSCLFPNVRINSSVIFGDSDQNPVKVNHQKKKKKPSKFQN